ncbi:CDP-archaeol synthase [Nitrosomonas sp.]|uniref:CDP-archaeol synthase n=1 Tax=Nitrosomonas sp. TaxID=42353 RepID=UPI0028529915|nr:CDP-archaeol synthase [Nitrosomonas sp.]
MNLQNMDTPLLHVLILIIIANGAPIVLSHLTSNKVAHPIDCGYIFLDRNRLLGNAKTWRGLIGSLLITSLFGLWLGYEFETGFLIAAGAMSGDLLSSFIKRRLSLPPSSMAPFLDQIPESLLPAMLVMQTFQLIAIDLAYLVAVFFVLEYVLSFLLYKLGIRKKPY